MCPFSDKVKIVDMIYLPYAWLTQPLPNLP